MRQYLGRRILFALMGVVGATLVAFTASHLAPGDPVLLMLGESSASPELMAAIRRLLDTGRVAVLELSCPWYPPTSADEDRVRASLLASLLTVD